jgi:hypothetical protein
MVRLDSKAWMVEHQHDRARIIGPRAQQLPMLLEEESMKPELHLRLRSSRAICAIALTALLATFAPLHAQMDGMAPAQPGAPLPSPAATATVTVAGGTIDVHYNTPHMRGRKIMGGLVPYGQVWRTGANPATTLITSVPLKFGDVVVPAGTHTIYTWPTADEWKLIINNETGQWGTEYKPEMDLGRTTMKAKPMSAPQEVMSISFEKTTPDSTELHVRWETTDRYVTITKP